MKKCGLCGETDINKLRHTLKGWQRSFIWPKIICSKCVEESKIVTSEVKSFIKFAVEKQKDSYGSKGKSIF